MIRSGGDHDVSAKAAGHSKETKARYYKKVSYEEVQELFGRYHLVFVGGGDNSIFLDLSFRQFYPENPSL